MKKIILAAILTLMAAGAAQAASVTANINMTYRSTIAASVASNMTYKLTRVAAKAGTYTVADMGFDTLWNSQVITPAVIDIQADATTAIDITYPASVSLGNGAAGVATLAVKAFGKAASAVTVPTDGAATTSTDGHMNNVTTGADGKFYLALAPNGIVFTDDVPGSAWAGTAPVTIDYTL